LIPGREKVKHFLDTLYEEYGTSYLETDPVSFPHRFSRDQDVEVAAFFSAILAFGKVAQIRKSVEDLLCRMGGGPYTFLLKSSEYRDDALRGFRHRFVGEEEMSCLMEALSRLITRFGSLKEAFRSCHVEGNIIESLSRFVKKIKEIRAREKGELKFLLPDPGKGSACKRLFLYLRWMVREEGGVDFGIFDFVDPSELIIPLDTHVGRLSQAMGLSRRRSLSLEMAKDITASLKVFDPKDPIKYDFAITRVGILEGCRGVPSPGCTGCWLIEKCPLSRTE